MGKRPAESSPITNGVGLVLFAAFVWPTPYEHWKVGYDEIEVRRIRFTGRTEVRWHSGSPWMNPPLVYAYTPFNPMLLTNTPDEVTHWERQHPLRRFLP